MPFISITRLRLRGLRFLPGFLYYSARSARQAERSPGFLGGRLGSEPGLTFWTITAWTDEAAMRAFRSSGAHRAAMPRLAGWCDEAATGHWQQDLDEVPDWPSAHARMRESGRAYPVRQPSSRQAEGVIPAPLVPGTNGSRLRPRHGS